MWESPRVISAAAAGRVLIILILKVVKLIVFNSEMFQKFGILENILIILILKIVKIIVFNSEMFQKFGILENILKI